MLSAPITISMHNPKLLPKKVPICFGNSFAQLSDKVLKVLHDFNEAFDGVDLTRADAYCDPVVQGISGSTHLLYMKYRGIQIIQLLPEGENPNFINFEVTDGGHLNGVYITSEAESIEPIQSLNPDEYIESFNRIMENARVIVVTQA